MGNKLIIGVDIDGVLSSFNKHYIKLIKDLVNIQLPEESSTYPDMWYYGRPQGYTKELETIVWDHIRHSYSFWADLPPYPDAEEFLSDLYADSVQHDVYFITDRIAPNAKLQTERWLTKHGYWEPTVIISKHKGAVCSAVNATHYIDDKNENCEDVVCNSPNTKCYMLARPWNERVAVAMKSGDIINVPRLNSLKEFLDILQEGK